MIRRCLMGVLVLFALAGRAGTRRRLPESQGEYPAQGDARSGATAAKACRRCRCRRRRCAASEKKREPSPPALVGNITFSPGVARKSGLTWETTIIDIEKWVEFTNSQLGQRYRYVGTDFAKFSYDPTELPILYFTGWKPLPEFDDATIAKLRQYLMDGGTLVVHSNCGRPEFNDSFRREIARIFPDRAIDADPRRSSDLLVVLQDPRHARPQGHRSLGHCRHRQAGCWRRSTSARARR